MPPSSTRTTVIAVSSTCLSACQSVCGVSLCGGRVLSVHPLVTYPAVPTYARTLAWRAPIGALLKKQKPIALSGSAW